MYNIRSLDMLENENVFITGGKDSMVKIWNLNYQNAKAIGKISPHIVSHTFIIQLVYNDHNHTVSSVRFINNGMQVASCANVVHVWDTSTKERLFHLAAESHYIRMELTKDERGKYNPRTSN